MATMTFGNPNDNWRKRQNYYERREQESGEVIKQIVKTLLVCLAFGLLGWLLSGCTTTKYVPVIEHTTDTLVQRVVERDSIHVHDSIRVSENGDTVTIERWHTQFRDRWHHDSVYVAKHDTIPQPYPVRSMSSASARSSSGCLSSSESLPSSAASCGWQTKSRSI